MLKNKTVQVICFCVSAILLGLAIACFIRSDLGIDPFSTFAQGITMYVPIHVDISIFLVSIGMLGLAMLINHKRLGFINYLYPFISSIALKFCLLWIPEGMLFYRIGLLGMGIFIMAISIALTSNSECGKNPYDSLNTALMNKLKLSYPQIRWMMDSVLLLCGLWMGGAYGIGTIVILLLIGQVANSCIALFKRYSWL